MMIIITHLTRMQPGFICVAGVEPQSGRQIRPVFKRGYLPRSLLRKDGGVFEIGAFVDLGVTKYVGRSPELEDHQFRPENLKYEERCSLDRFHDLLKRTSRDRLELIFGNDLTRCGGSCTVKVGAGIASLGHLRPHGVSHLSVNNFGRIRLAVSDGQFDPSLSVTDVRLYENDQKNVRVRIVEAVAAKLDKVGAVLAVGLSRPWAKDEETGQRHWLQINNIHFDDDPLGEIFQF